MNFTNQPTNSADELPVPGQETVQKQEIGKKKLAYLIVGVVFVLLLAIFGLIGGFISTGNKQEGAVANSFDLAPPDAKPKQMDDKNKYDLGYSLSPNITASNALDRQAAESTEKLTGHGPALKMTNNESLTETDYHDVRKAGGTAITTPTERKNLHQRQFDQQNRRAVTEQNRVLRTMYQSPRSREQRADQLAEREERDYNRRTTEAVLKQIELANQSAHGAAPSPTAVPATSAEPLHVSEYKQVKQSFGGQIPPDYRSYFAR